ncbi:MAG: sugar-binding protein, partial [Calditrichaceae bacterium]
MKIIYIYWHYGYIYEVALSITDLSNHLALNAEAGNQFGIDIAIGDNDSSERDHLLIWNSPGTDPNYWEKPVLWATAQFSDLVAEMETILIPKTPDVITIDGSMDPIWQYAARTKIRRGNKPFISDEDFASEVRFLWDDNNLYIYAIVNDDIVNTSNSAYWLNDVFQFFIDANFERNHEYDQEDLQFSYVVNSDGLSNVWNPYYYGIHSTADFPNCQFVSSETEYGYDYEIKLSGSDLSSQLNFNLSPEKVFGLEIEFADNDTGDRESTITWTSPWGSDYWLYPDTWGKAQLTEVIAEPKQITIPKIADAITIDGNMEDAWHSANPEPIDQILTVSTIPDDINDFSGEYRMLWDDDNLYLFVSVTDNILNTSNPDFWNNDVIQFYLDGNNEKTNIYDQNDLQFSCVANTNYLTNVYSFENGLNYSVDDFSNCQFVSIETSNGYNYEILLSGNDLSNQLGINLSVDNKLGFDLALNDNDTGTMKNSLLWSAPFGSEMWYYPSLWGTATLVEIPANLSAVTNTASDIGYTTAVLNGTVNSDGLTMNVS